MRRTLVLALVLVGCGGSVESPGLSGRNAGASGAPSGPGAGDDAVDDDGGGTDEGGGNGDGMPDVVDDPPPPAPTGRVPVFIAQGHMGRTIISCDDGRTWHHDVSANANARCFENGLDCDHSEHSALGIIYGDGAFYATYGWGYPGKVVRSTDGRNWTTLLTGTTFSNMALGNGYLIGGDHYPRRSDDNGATWTEGTIDSGLTTWTTRNIGFAPVNGGRWILIATNDTRDLVVSSDNGGSWHHPRTLPSTCGESVSGIQYGRGTIVVTGGNGVSCTSTDAGETFVAHDIGGRLTSSLIWDGTLFHAWGYGVHYSSRDGVTWNAANTVPEEFDVRAVARSDAGTFAAVNNSWLSYYEDQHFYRSTDGTNWEVLPASAFTGSHPTLSMAFGRVPTSPCD